MEFRKFTLLLMFSDAVWSGGLSKSLVNIVMGSWHPCFYHLHSLHIEYIEYQQSMC